MGREPSRQQILHNLSTFRIPLPLLVSTMSEAIARTFEAAKAQRKSSRPAMDWTGHLVCLFPLPRNPTVPESGKSSNWNCPSLTRLFFYSPADRPAFVGYITAGYPDADDTVELLLAMERGGVDIIELGGLASFRRHGARAAPLTVADSNSLHL